MSNSKLWLAKLILYLLILIGLGIPPPLFSETKKNQVLSYGVSQFFVTPDFKQDIIIHLTILRKEQYLNVADKCSSVIIHLQKAFKQYGFLMVGGIDNDDTANSRDIHITQNDNIIVVAIHDIRKNICEKKIFNGEGEKDIANDIILKLFGREA